MADLVIRPAREEELQAVLDLLEDGSLRRESASADDEAYRAAFREMQRSADNRTYVAELAGEVVGTLQLTFIRHLMRRGTLIAQIEAVRVSTAQRNHGIGSEMMRWAVSQARRRGCSRVQLSSNKQRLDAHRFYQRLGFAKSHEGFKLPL
jgi:predicted N-acetyltransferase YhbS